MSRAAKVAAVLVSAACALAAAAPTGPRNALDLQVPDAPTPVAVFGKSLLVYELHLTNFSAAPLRVDGVRVVAADDAVIEELAAPEIARRLGEPGVKDGDDRSSLSAGTRAVLYLELVFEGDGVPAELVHVVSFHTPDETSSVSSVSSVAGARIVVSSEPPPVLSPPLRGGPWAAVYSAEWERGHRRVFYAPDGRARIPGRHAIDFVRLDRDGRTAHDDADTIANWHGYGAEVLAVADGVVASVRDDLPEAVTLSDYEVPAPGDATGNYVSLDIGNGRFAFYEHLKPRSIRVEPGERVRRGEVIGELGFTGSTTGPHLHFHVADANSALGAEGRPFVPDEFLLLGGYDDFGRFGSAAWTAVADPAVARRVHELPDSNVVVRFPYNRGAEPGAPARPTATDRQ
jgi:murein DD-endopeptidase MepM/ murein hydrolase activator NlpD